jgi:hypothetical protein
MTSDVKETATAYFLANIVINQWKFDMAMNAIRCIVLDHLLLSDNIYDMYLNFPFFVHVSGAYPENLVCSTTCLSSLCVGVCRSSGALLVTLGQDVFQVSIFYAVFLDF